MQIDAKLGCQCKIHTLLHRFFNVKALIGALGRFVLSSIVQNCLLFTLPWLGGGAGSPGGRGRFVTNSHCQEHLYWSLPTARTRGATVKISQTLFVCVTPESGHQPPAMNEISKLIRQSPAPPQIYFKTLFRDTTHISLVMLGLVHCLQQSGDSFAPLAFLRCS